MLKHLKQLTRLIHISSILARHRLDEVLLATKLFYPYVGLFI